MKLTIGFHYLLIIPIVYGFLNEESVKEHGCVEPTLTELLNFNWVQSVPEWYSPLWSQLELYRSAPALKNTSISEIQEHELYYDACLTYKFGEENPVTFYGFNGEKADYTFTPVSPNVFRFDAESKNSSGGHYVTMTDNKTFMFWLTCWEDGQASWSVGTPAKALDEKTVQKIHAHVKSLGFKEEHFTKLRYETCTNN